MSISCKNFSLILFFTFILNGGLNHVILRFLFLFALLLEKDVELLFLLLVLWDRLLVYDNFVEYPLFDSASSYSAFDFSNISWLDEFFDSLSRPEFGICLIICSGWFHEVQTYNNLLFGFLNWRYVPFSKLNVTSKKSSIFNSFECRYQSQVFWRCI